MKIKTGLSGLILVIAASVIGGCASQPKLTQDQILSQYDQLSTLSRELKDARLNDADMLAPESFETASEAFEDAMDSAHSNKSEAAEQQASDGLKAISKLKRDIKTSNNLLAEVIQARDRAHAAGVKTLQSEKIADLDKDLKKTAALIEQSKLEQAKQRRPKLIEGYKQLELVALKQGNAELARSSIAEASENGAEKLAPKTFAEAKEKMALAQTILDADRTQTDKADAQTKRAKWLAEKSSSIAETVKDFERRDYSMEDVVLWHQQQLSAINKPLGGELPFNRPADDVVVGLTSAVSALLSERDMTKSQLLETEQLSQARIKAAEEKYGQQLAMTQKERLDLQQKDRADREKFEVVQAMFTAKEANVYRQRQNVLISAHGFQFPSGQSEIQTENFPLMSKITRAIKTFPNARIEISGHTDSTGDVTINQVLSEARAQKVAKFLTQVGGINPKNIVSNGFGENRPVATNETALGRAENRRVEINIINK